MSICIVHRDGWAACDSRTTLGHKTIFPAVANKAFTASGWLVASVGTGALETRMRRFIPQHFEADVLQNVSESLQDKPDDGSALLMTSRQRDLILIDGNGSVETIDDQHQFWAVGCCEEMVLGYLFRVVEHEKRGITPEDAKSAIVMAASYDSGIDDRVKIFYLNG